MSNIIGVVIVAVEPNFQCRVTGNAVELVVWFLKNVLRIEEVSWATSLPNYKVSQVTSMLQPSYRYLIFIPFIHAAVVWVARSSIWNTNML